MSPPLLEMRPAAAGDIYRVFISSPQDAAAVRDRLKGLIQEAINPVLVDSEAGFTLYPDMWERTVPQKAPTQNELNAIFVKRAQQSHVTVVVFVDHKGPGTVEELEAVMAEEGVLLSVFRFTGRSEEEAASDELGLYLDAIRDKILFEVEFGGPDSNEAWFAITRALTSIVVSALMPRLEAPYHEVRA